MPSPVVGAIGSVVGGLSQASAAKKAAGAQAAAAQNELDLQKSIYEETSANFDPYRQGGGLGFQAYLSEMGLADRPMIGGTAPQIETFTTPGQTTPGATFNPSAYGGFGRSSGGSAEENAGFYSPGPTTTPGVTQYRVGGQTFSTMEEAQAYANANPTGGQQFGGFKETPGYQFQLARGQDAVASSGAARGNYLSGANLAGAMEFGQGLANQEYNNYLNRLQGIGQQGQSAAGNQAAAGQAYAAGAGNAYAGIGNAQAAGAIGQGNAFTGIMNNLSGTFGYLNSQQPAAGAQNANIFSAGWGSKGFWG